MFFDNNTYMGLRLPAILDACEKQDYRPVPAEPEKTPDRSPGGPDSPAAILGSPPRGLRRLACAVIRCRLRFLTDRRRRFIGRARLLNLGQPVLSPVNLTERRKFQELLER